MACSLPGNLFYNSPYICLSVAVRKRQVAVLARSSREISQTVRIDCRSFLLRVRISVRPSKFFIGKKYPKISAGARVFSLLPAIGWNGGNLNSDDCGHNGGRFSKNGDNETFIPLRPEQCGPSYISNTSQTLMIFPSAGTRLVVINIQTPLNFGSFHVRSKYVFCNDLILSFVLQFCWFVDIYYF